MILAIHIIIALSSLIIATLLTIKPSKSILYTSYTLAGGTLLSGIVLVVTEPATMLRACIAGILYFVAVVGLTIVARRKLATTSVKA